MPRLQLRLECSIVSNRLRSEVLSQKLVGRVIRIEAIARGKEKRGFRRGLLREAQLNPWVRISFELAIPQLIEDGINVYEVRNVTPAPRIPVEPGGRVCAVSEMLQSLG